MRRGTRQPRKARFEGESFGMPLADLLTTALGCMMLIFMVASTYMKDSLLEGQLTQDKMRVELMDADERQRLLERLKAELSEELKALKAALAQERASLDDERKRVEELKVGSARQESAAQQLQRELDEARLLLQSRALDLKKVRSQAKRAFDDLNPESARPVDVMLVIDGTRSMQPSLDATRANLKATIGALRIVSPSVRVGVTVFRDRRERPKVRLEHQPLTEDETQLKRFLSQIEAKSTRRDRDRPEWLCGGLARAVKADWRRGAIKIIAVVSDAATQSKGAKRCVELARGFHKSGGLIHLSSTLPEGYGKRRDVTREYDEVVLKEHALIAEAGGGEHIKRADEATLLEAVLRAAFTSRLSEPLKALGELGSDSSL